MNYLRKVFANNTRENTFLCHFIISAGILTRIIIFFCSLPLSIDEISRIEFIRNSEYIGFLSYRSPLFLSLTKAVSELMGYNSYAIRFIPLLCSIGVLFLIYMFCRNCIKINPVIPLIIAVITDKLLYSFDTIDVFICLLVAYISYSVVSRRMALWIFTMISVLAVLFSFPPAIPVLSLLVYIVSFKAKAKDAKDLIQSILCLAVYGLFFCLYSLFLISETVFPGMLGYDTVKWVFLDNYAAIYMKDVFSYIFLILTILGTILMIKRKERYGWIFILTALFYFITYGIFEVSSLFLFGMNIIVLGYIINNIICFFKYEKWIAISLAIIFLAGIYSYSAENIINSGFKMFSINEIILYLKTSV